MKQSLLESETQNIVSSLKLANERYGIDYPDDSFERQPVHTVYGGANLFKAGSTKKLGALALRSLDIYAPDFASFFKVIDPVSEAALPYSKHDLLELRTALKAQFDTVKCSNPEAAFAYTLYQRVYQKLSLEPIEDSRIDFEDGYGNRSDEEEDAHAIAASSELAVAMEEGTVPPFIGIRIKSFTEECRVRAFRTLDLFLTNLSEKTAGKLPDNFVVTLPKVTIPEQVSSLVRCLELIESKTDFPAGSLKLEIMIETTQAIVNKHGQVNIPLLVGAGEGRCRAAIFGTYDYTAACNITAAYQTHTHSACDMARHIMQISLAGTGVHIVDGATTIMPIAPHKVPKEGGGLNNQQIQENQRVVHDAWKLHFDNIHHSLAHAFYQGWDLNPAQLPIRYAAVYSFFLRGLEDASKRLNAFLARAAQATLVGNTFDDAATGQGLLNFFLRGMACGAITEEEVLATGITLEELRSRSFVQIVTNRTAK